MPKKVLVIDDDRSVGQGLEQPFKNYGVQIANAPDLQTGISVFEAENFPVILIKLEFDELPGLKLLQRFRLDKNMEKRATTAILMSGRARPPKTETLIKELGGIECLPKPLKPITVLSYIGRGMAIYVQNLQFYKFRQTVTNQLEKPENFAAALKSIEAKIPEFGVRCIDLMVELFDSYRNFDAGFKFFSERLTRDAASPILMGAKGRMLLRLGRFPEAKEALETADKASPLNLRRLADLEDVYLALQENDRAAEAMRERWDAWVGNEEERGMMLAKLESAGGEDLVKQFSSKVKISAAELAGYQKRKDEYITIISDAKSQIKLASMGAKPIKQLLISDAILLTERSEILQALRTELKELGIVHENIHPMKTAAECIDKLNHMAQVLLVIDWDVGISDVLKVLTANQNQHKGEARPTFMIAAQMNQDLVAVGAEFGVSFVHTGELSQSTINCYLKAILKDCERLTLVKSALLNVERVRSEGNWESATKILEAVNVERPHNPKVVLELAENYLHTKSNSKAFSLLTTFVQDSGSARGYHLLARCHLRFGERDKAIESMKKAQLLNPINPGRLIELGEILLRADRIADAAKNFDQAMEFAPGDRSATKGLAKCELLDGDVNEALAMLREISDGEELASVFNTAAVIAIHNGKFDQGMKLYDSAAKAIGNQPPILARLQYNRGLGFHRNKMPDEAAKAFGEAVKLDPTFENARHNLQVLKGEKGALIEEVATKLPPVQKKLVPTPVTAASKTAPAEKEADVANSIANIYAVDFDDEKI